MPGADCGAPMNFQQHLHAPPPQPYTQLYIQPSAPAPTFGQNEQQHMPAPPPQPYTQPCTHVTAPAPTSGQNEPQIRKFSSTKEKEKHLKTNNCPVLAYIDRKGEEGTVESHVTKIGRPTVYTIKTANGGRFKLKKDDLDVVYYLN